LVGAALGDPRPAEARQDRNELIDTQLGPFLQHEFEPVQLEECLSQGKVERSFTRYINPSKSDNLNLGPVELNSPAVTVATPVKQFHLAA
jgi:hypothetical protein